MRFPPLCGLGQLKIQGIKTPPGTTKQRGSGRHNLVRMDGRRAGLPPAEHCVYASTMPRDRRELARVTALNNPGLRTDHGRLRSYQSEGQAAAIRKIRSRKSTDFRESAIGALFRLRRKCTLARALQTQFLLLEAHPRSDRDPIRNYQWIASECEKRCQCSHAPLSNLPSFVGA